MTDVDVLCLLSHPLFSGKVSEHVKSGELLKIMEWQSQDSSACAWN